MEKSKRKMDETRKKKTDPLFEIEGNQKLNKMNKLRFKKEKKEQARRGKNIFFFFKKKTYFFNIYFALLFEFYRKSSYQVGGPTRRIQHLNI